MPWEFGQCMSALVPAVKLSVCLSRNFSISLLAPQNVWSVEQISPYLNPTAIHGCQDRPILSPLLLHSMLEYIPAMTRLPVRQWQQWYLTTLLRVGGQSILILLMVHHLTWSHTTPLLPLR